MLSFRKKKLVFDITRCCQCGGCLAACERGALTSELNIDGLWLIGWQEKLCDLCGKCVLVCPAQVLPEKPLTAKRLNNLKKVVLAYATDEEQRKIATSGGVARMLLAGTINKGLMDGAYALGRTLTYPWAEGRFWTAPVDLGDVPTSMYLPIMATKNLRIEKSIKSLMLIGTNCQLLAAEKLVYKKVERLAKVNIYCKQQKTLGLLKYLSKRVGTKIALTGPQGISFRGDGWPGKVRIDQKEIAYDKAAAIPFGKKLWRIPGCRFCPNPVGVNVDLTLADPWGIEKQDTMGKTLVFVWTDVGQQILDQNMDLLHIDPLPLDSSKSLIGWIEMERKRRLVDYYIGKKVHSSTKVAAKGEQLQIQILEALLEKYRLPELLYKLLAHIPDIGKLA